MKNKDFMIIAVLFYVGWFGSVFLAKVQLSVVSLIFPLIMVGFLILKKSLTLKETKIALAISIVGFLFDAALIHFGLVSVVVDSVLHLPIWLISIWLLFSFSMIKLGLKLQPPILVATVLGAVMGPLSYKSGEYFKVLNFTSNLAFPIYAIFWGFAFPIVLNLSKRNSTRLV